MALSSGMPRLPQRPHASIRLHGYEACGDDRIAWLPSPPLPRERELTSKLGLKAWSILGSSRARWAQALYGWRAG